MATRTRYAPDRGLTVRMTVTMFLLGLVFVAFVAAHYRHVDGGSRVGRGDRVRRPDLRRRRRDRLAVLLATRSRCPRRAPRSLPRRRRRSCTRIVDRLCALADMDKPRVAIAPTRMPNAFATGRNSKNSVLCVTEGLLYQQQAHHRGARGRAGARASHVAHKDVQVMTVASLLAIVAGLLVRFAFYSELFGGGRREQQQQPGRICWSRSSWSVSVVVYAVSFLLIRVLSRYRELAADRSGALLTGQPERAGVARCRRSARGCPGSRTRTCGPPSR